MNADSHSPMSGVRTGIAAGAALALAAWIVTHVPRLLETQHGLIRMVLGLVFMTALLLRRSPGSPSARSSNPLLHALAACIATGLLVGGLVLGVHQFEWLGLLLLTGTLLAWALPSPWRSNVLPAFSLLYWVHPLPGQLFTPLERAMQAWTVQGTEALLHALNIRAWADGLVLRTGMMDIEVPAACNGMRAGVTVLLMVIGLLLLYRLPPASWAVFLPLAFLQTLALNIVRITVVVVFARYEAAGGPPVLHDAAGLIALLGVLIAYVEILSWRSDWQQSIAERQEPGFDRLQIMTELPPFWHRVVRHRGSILSVLAVAIVASVVAFKLRPYHRAEMIKNVAIALRDAGRLDVAGRAADAVAQLVPYDTEWRATRARLWLLQGRYADALRESRLLPGHSPRLLLERQLLQAYACMGLKRVDEARALVAAIPERYRLQDPQVAMILAELAFYAGRVDEVAAHAESAARMPSNLERIRALYPYLRAHRRWQTIRRTDRSAPYTEPASAFAASEAYMNLSDVGHVASVVEQAMRKWPLDGRILEPLYFMALRREGTAWESRFATHLAAWAQEERDPELLYHHVPKCFTLGRPDLAWILCGRIRAVDARHPLLYLAAARYGDVWFTFRKSAIGMPAAYPQETFRAESLFHLGLVIPSWRPICRWIAFGEALSGADTENARRQLLATALGEFQARGADAPLSLNQQYEHIRALELADDTDDALKRLDQLGRDNPGQADRNRLVLSGIYEQQGEWTRVYEALHGYPETANPDLVPLLRLSRTQLGLGMYLGALFTARVAAGRYPDSSHAAANLAQVLLAGNRPDEALAVAQAPRSRRSRDLDRLEAEALYRTQRFSELLSFCRSVLLPAPPLPADVRQDIFLPPAELALQWHRLAVPSRKAALAHAAFLRREAKRLPTAFVGPLARLWVDTVAACAGDREELVRWEACGRSRVERAMALNQLTLLRCFHGRMPEAAEAAAEAVRILPESELLWYIHVGLATNQATVLRDARQACPDDPELWLADIVVRSRNPTATDERLLAGLREDAQLATLPPATLTRAAEFLLQTRMPHAAAHVAREAARRGRGFVPACLTTLRCAMALHDPRLALEGATRAIESMVQPPTGLYRMLVSLKTEGTRVAMDDSTLQALRVLRRAEPDNALWAQMLGMVRFNRGGWDLVDAQDQMASALEAGVTNRTSYLVAAEASRLLGNLERACDTLREGLRRHPGDLAMRNNLVYTLASMPSGIREAVAMVPSLLAQAPENLAVLDTACMAYLRAGEPGKARALIDQVLAQQSAGSRFWFRAHLHAAELELATGSPRRAQDHLLAAAPHTKGIPDEDVLRARKLLLDVDALLNEKPPVDPNAPR